MESNRAFYIDKNGRIISNKDFTEECSKDISEEKISEHTKLARNVVRNNQKLEEEFNKSRWFESGRYDLFLIEKGYVAIGCFEISGGVVLYNSRLISEKQRIMINKYDDNEFALADYAKSETLSKSEDNENEDKKEDERKEAESDGR